MNIDLPEFFNWEDAKRYAFDLMQWGDDGPCPEGLAESIEAALEESKRLKAIEDRKKDA
jgi:hypothetical protein